MIKDEVVELNTTSFTGAGFFQRSIESYNLESVRGVLCVSNLPSSLDLAPAVCQENSASEWAFEEMMSTGDSLQRSLLILYLHLLPILFLY